ncbi:MAG: plastocyanin/azurin family copper-binding protein, partial [Acidimicrobiia bacterium]
AESEGADHAESEGADHADDHGAMIEVEPGGEITLRFTIPADATGTYEMGCFLPGHYDAGMKGTVTVTG